MKGEIKCNYCSFIIPLTLIRQLAFPGLPIMSRTSWLTLKAFPFRTRGTWQAA